MALACFSSLCRGVALQRQALLRLRPVVGASARPCSGPDKELTSNVTRKQRQASSGDNFGRIDRKGFTDHKVSNLERYFLVWGGNYKTRDEVPAFVSQDTMERARNKARIKINIITVFATLIACLVMIQSGKFARDSGESVTKMNMDWHKKLNTESSKLLKKEE